MHFIKKYKDIICSTFIVCMVVASIILIDKGGTHTQYKDCVAGLISNNEGGSNFVVYDTENWKSTTILKLPEVTLDNFAAISNDGNNIAYTRWDDNYIRRYLMVYSCSDKKLKSFYEDLPSYV